MSQSGIGNLNASGNGSVTLLAGTGISISGGNPLHLGGTATITNTGAVSNTYFSVKLSADVPNGAGAGGRVICPFDSVIVDTASAFSIGSSQYVCPTTGFMCFGFSMSYTVLNGATGTSNTMVIFNNTGSKQYNVVANNPFVTQDTVGTIATQAGTVLVPVTAGDIIEFDFYMGSGGVPTVTILGGVRYSNAYGFYL